MTSLYTLVVSTAIVLIYFQQNHYVEGKSVTNQEPEKKGIIEDLMQEKFKEKIKESFWGFFKSNDQCKKTKKARKEASALNGDSPLKSFGYPNFDIANQGYSTLHPGVSLTLVNKEFLTPVITGARDFYIAGKPADILAFCECFENYHVIGQVLQDNGHWKNGTGDIQIQVSDEAQYKISKGASLFDMIFKMTLDRIVKELDVKSKISANAGIIGSALMKSMFGVSEASLGAKLRNFKEHFEQVRKWIPEAPEVIEGVRKIINTGGISDQDMFDKFKSFVENVIKKKEKNDGKKVWLDKKNLSKKGGVIACLTMYPKPPNSLRTTYNFGKSEITMGDVGKALEQILK